MPNFKVTFITLILAYTTTLSFNISYAIEKPQSPFMENNQEAKKNSIAIINDSPPKQEFVSLKNITIATSPSTHNIGEVICSLINYNQQKTGIKCNTKKGEGSIKNIEALNHGGVDLAIISSGIAHDKLQQKNTSSNDSKQKYRFVLSLYPEVLNILVKDTSEIKNIEDIKDKIIDVSSNNSTNNEILEKILEAKNWSSEDFKGIEYISNKDKPNALCTDKVDAILLYSGIPDSLVNKITQSCQARIIPIDENLINKLSISDSFISKQIIPEGTYLNNPMNISTFGTPVLIITTDDFDRLAVYNLVKMVLQNINTLKKLHPAFDIHPINELVNNRDFIPYHEGAAILFREEKLIDE